MKKEQGLMIQMVVLFCKRRFKRGSANVKLRAAGKKPQKIIYCFSYRH